MTFPAKVYRFIPDKISKGGTKTSVTTHTELDDVREVVNLFVHFSRWRRALRAALVPGMTVQANIVNTPSMHNFTRYDDTNYNAGMDGVILLHNVKNDDTHYIFDATINNIVHTGGPVSPDEFVPASMMTVKNRCFIAWGGSNNFIYNGTSDYDVGVDAPPTAATYTLAVGNLTWTGYGPQYAYAYYDSVTGHISNPSPITQIVEQAQTLQKVTLQAIVDPPVADLPRFDKIQVFSTLLEGGNTLYPMSDGGPANDGTLNTGTGPHTFVDNLVDHDEKLLTSGGLEAPPGTNKKPPPFAVMDYWDSRIWGVPVEDPTAVQFSGDPALILYGIPEECYPANNKLRIPSRDGRVTGLKVVGSTLVVTTERFAYYVAGSGDQAYRLLRFASGTAGVTNGQMDEFAGDTSENSDALVYVGKDANVYMLAPGYGNVSLSDPIAPSIAASIFYPISRVTSAYLTNTRIVVLSFAQLGNPTYVYDFDRKIWTTHLIEVETTGSGLSPQSFETVFGDPTKPSLLYCAQNGVVYAWPQNSTSTEAATLASIQIPPMSFGGGKRRRQLNFVRLYVSSDALSSPGWRVSVSPNEALNGYAMTAVPNSDPLQQLIPVGVSSPVDALNAVELIAVPPVTEQLWGFRFNIGVTWPSGDNINYDLYAIDVCLQDVEEEGEGQ